jgi:putative endonuclease
MGSRQNVGFWGENLAAQYLQAQGYSVLERNVRTPYGEIDLVVQKGSPPITVFVEVKTRRTRSFGLPEDSVTARKQAHLLASVAFYAQNHPELVGEQRVDVISIQRYDPKTQPIITHFENAVS